MLIMACDGVWDVLSDQEAADLLLEQYLAGGCQPYEGAAELLVCEYSTYTARIQHRAARIQSSGSALLNPKRIQ
jgi:serine/threonine protein phosphatase PrpC